MKRAKKAKLIITTVERNIYSVVCPHCHTECIGGLGDGVLMFKCYNCKNPIDLRPKETKG